VRQRGENGAPDRFEPAQLGQRSLIGLVLQLLPGGPRAQRALVGHHDRDQERAHAVTVHEDLLHERRGHQHILEPWWNVPRQPATLK
jgi:hypothetical protein